MKTTSCDLCGKGTDPRDACVYLRSTGWRPSVDIDLCRDHKVLLLEWLKE